MVLRRRDLVVEQRLQLVRVDPADVDRRLVGRVGGDRADRAVARVDRHDRAAGSVVRLVGAGDPDPLAQRALGGALQPAVEGELHRPARMGVLARLEAALRDPERVDADLREPGAAAQVLVERRFDSGLADLVPGAIPVVPLRLQLLRRDLAYVAEHVRGHRLVLVAAQVRAGDAHSPELGLVLREVVDLRLVHGGLDGDRRQRVALRLLDLADEPAERHVQDLREPPEHPVAPLLRQVADPDLDGGSRDVGDDRVAVSVEDRAARRLDADRPDLVVLGRGEVGVAGEHLQRPEPEEEEAEDAERERAEDAHPKRELRRQTVRLVRLRVGRQEAARGRAALVDRASQGAAPPARARPGRSGRGRGGRARTPARR